VSPSTATHPKSIALKQVRRCRLYKRRAWPWRAHPPLSGRSADRPAPRPAKAEDGSPRPAPAPPDPRRLPALWRGPSARREGVPLPLQRSPGRSPVTARVRRAPRQREGRGGTGGGRARSRRGEPAALRLPLTLSSERICEGRPNIKQLVSNRIFLPPSPLILTVCYN